MGIKINLSIDLWDYLLYAHFITIRKENKMYYILKQRWDSSVDTTYMADKGYATLEMAEEKRKALEILNENEEVKFLIVTKVA